MLRPSRFKKEYFRAIMSILFLKMIQMKISSGMKTMSRMVKFCLKTSKTGLKKKKNSNENVHKNTLF